MVVTDVIKGRLGRSFWLLWTASTASAFGDGMRYVVFPLLAADLTADPRGVSLVFATGYLPWLLFGLISGAVVDRVDRRKLMWRIDLARFVVVALFAVLVAAQPPPIVLLAMVSFGLGVAETFFDNSASAIMPMMVSGPPLERANSWLMASQTLNTTLIGTFAGAALYGWHHDVPLILDALSFLVAALLVAAIRGTFVAESNGAPTTVRQDVVDGLRWLWRHRLLRTCCMLVLAVNWTLAAAESVLVFYTRNLLHLGDLGYSMLLGLLAIGGIAGSFAAPVLRPRVSLPVFLLATVLAQSVALILSGVLPDLPFAVLSFTLVGMATAAWNVTTVSLRQKIVPAGLLGRVTSSYRLVGLAAMPVGAAFAGVVAQAYGLRTVFIGSGILLLVAAGLSVRPLRESAAALDAAGESAGGESAGDLGGH